MKIRTCIAAFVLLAAAARALSGVPGRKAPATSTPRSPHLGGTRESIAILARHAAEINHDLRTPVGTVATALELLREDRAAGSKLDPETLHVLERQVSKLTAIADALSQLADDLAKASAE